MKQLVFLIATFFTFSTGLKSQNYVPFPTEKVHWNVLYIGTCEERPPDTTILRYTIHGDTTINNITYRKLCLESGDTMNPKIRGIGGIREANKKIYYNGETVTFNTDSKEYLLYDFTKQIGDTIKHNPQGYFYSVVLDIDSVLIDGAYRKRYKIYSHSFGEHTDYIIEGIGSVVNGLLGNISEVPTCGYHYWKFICFKENDNLLYLNPSFTDCQASNFLMSSNLPMRDSQIKIYPNPVTNELQIEMHTDKDRILKIINMDGRSILEKHLSDMRSVVKLNVSPGLYQVIIINQVGQTMLTQTIIKR